MFIKQRNSAIVSRVKDFLGEAQNEQCFSKFQASDLLTAEGPSARHTTSERRDLCEVRCGALAGSGWVPSSTAV